MVAMLEAPDATWHPSDSLFIIRTTSPDKGFRHALGMDAALEVMQLLKSWENEETVARARL